MPRVPAPFLLCMSSVSLPAERRPYPRLIRPSFLPATSAPPWERTSLHACTVPAKRSAAAPLPAVREAPSNSTRMYPQCTHSPSQHNGNSPAPPPPPPAPSAPSGFLSILFFFSCFHHSNYIVMHPGKKNRWEHNAAAGGGKGRVTRFGGDCPSLTESTAFYTKSTGRTSQEAYWNS